MGGFGFGNIAELKMLGFYQAIHHRTQRQYLAYVIQITLINRASFLIYRRYSQIASLAAKLHFHPSVGLPPKYALQVFPLTEDQLRQRFDGLQAFLTLVFQTLQRQFEQGLHHDVNCMAGLDMQMFYDFVCHHRNRPPRPVKSLPDWAIPRRSHLAGAFGRNDQDDDENGNSRNPSINGESQESLTEEAASSMDDEDIVTLLEEDGSGELRYSRDSTRAHTWLDVDSVDSEDVQFESEARMTESIGPLNVSQQLRNEVLQAEASVNALWNCVQAYTQATHAWYEITTGLMEEFRRASCISLCKSNEEVSGVVVATIGHGSGVVTSTTTATSSSPDETSRISTGNHDERFDELKSFMAQFHLKTVESQLPQFQEHCQTAVLAPLESLVRELLPEVKHSYWNRLSSIDEASMKSMGTESENEMNGSVINKRTQCQPPVIIPGQPSLLQDFDNGHQRRLLMERSSLHTRIKQVLESSFKSLVTIQSDFLHTVLQSFESSDNRLTSDAQNQVDFRGESKDDHEGADEDNDEQQEETVEEKAHDDENEDESDEEDDEVKPDGKDRSVSNQMEDKEPTPEQLPIVGMTTPTALALVVEQDHSSANSGNQTPQSTPTLQVEIPRHEEPSNTHRIWLWGRSPVPSVTVPILRPKQTRVLSGQKLVQIACGGDNLIFLTESGDVYSYGEEEKRSRKATLQAPRLVEEFALEKALHCIKIIKVSCGAQHSLGITNVGELYTWGSGEDGRLGHGDMRDRAVPRKVMSLLRHRVVDASCGGAHTAVLTQKHKLFAFGRGRNGRLGLGDNKWRDSPHQVTAFPQNTPIVRIACGWNFTVALSQQGNVFSWGKQGEGQCGLGYLDKDQLVPCNVAALNDVEVVEIACGYTHSIALASNGQVFSWGLGEYGQLGRGVVYQPLPEMIDFAEVLCAPDRIDQVYCGPFHCVAMSRQRVMFSWGLNMHGACGLGHTLNRDSPERIDCFANGKDVLIACGQKFTIAMEIEKTLPPSVSINDPSSLQTAPRGEAQFSTPASTIPSPSAAARNDFNPLSLLGGRLTPKVLTPVANAPHDESSSRVNIHEKEEELRRAKKMWRTRILKDWEENRDTPLAHTMWRQGIPPSIRARVWPLAIGNKLKITPEMYQIYRRRAMTHKQKNGNHGIIGREDTVALIDTDLPRTFPSLKLFDSSGPYFDYLQEVLETYACYRPDLGYIQGMSYLAAMLCLHMPHDRYLSFQCLANLMVNEHLFTFYLLDVELSDVYYTLFDELLSARLPELHEHLKNLGMSCSMYLMNWLQTLFLQVLPLEMATRVFDNFLLDGTVFLFRTALAIHELLLPELANAEIDRAMPILQKNPMYQSVWDCHVKEDELFATITKVVVPSHIYSALDRVINDVFFYEKHKKSKQSYHASVSTARGHHGFGGGNHRTDIGGSGVGGASGAVATVGGTGGQSVGIGRVKHERRSMYTISDTLNGVLGGF